MIIRPWIFFWGDKWKIHWDTHFAATVKFGIPLTKAKRNVDETIVIIEA
jgi:hypothetical protein